MGPTRTKSRRKNYYAVRIGRGGRKIYNNWTEARAAVHRFSHGQAKGFYDLASARSWLNGLLYHEQNRIVQSTDSPQHEVGSMMPSTSKFTTNVSEAHPTISHHEVPLLKNVEEDNLVTHTHFTCDTPQQGRIEREESLDMDCFIKALNINSSQDAVSTKHATAARNGEQIDPSTNLETPNISTSLTEDMPKTEKHSATSSVPDELPKLSEEQNKVLEQVKSGRSIFFTGPAGSGKSVLLRAIIKYLKQKSLKMEIAITASTGLAAINIGGNTLHSFSGAGLAKGTAGDLISKLSMTATSRWITTKVLIIDEISMVDGKFFDKLETMARKIRDNKQPFGGIQLIISGDFCQLPPVPDMINGIQMPVAFAFEAESWSKCIKNAVQLNEVHRQKEKTFVRVLNGLRNGRLNERDARILSSLSRPIPNDDGIEPAELFPLRREVEAANARRLDQLPGRSITYESIDSAGFDSNGNRISGTFAARLLDRLTANKFLTLKIGAQVMLIKNRNDIFEGSSRLVNGSIGKVVDFVGVDVIAERIHELSSIVREENKAWYIKKLDEDKLYPLVRFENGRSLFCTPETFSVVGLHGNWEASRWQLPLILAWAMSVHKSQGQTLSRLKVDLKRTFENGQAYVALSRVKSMDGLQILNFDPAKVMAHPRVLKWHDQLENQLVAKEFSNESVFKSFYEDEDDKSI